VNALIILSTFAFACMGTFLLRRHALQKNLLDIPNHRSSHTIPTPRGGGVAIVISFFIAIIAGLALDKVKLDVSIALIGAGLVVALIGFMDDLKPLSAKIRMAAHSIASAWAIAWIGPIKSIELPFMNLDFGIIGLAISLLFLIWMLNLYNFMDGIDGIASVEAISVCLLYVVLMISGTETSNTTFILLSLAAATLGFLVWNYPKAKIFMGDAGSGFLGITLGILVISTSSPTTLWCWLILLGAFITDATFTLIRRLINKEKLYLAHRSHAYQHAVLIHGSHSLVTNSVLLLNLFWLFPLSALAYHKKIDGIYALLIAYIPLLVLCVRYKAGSSSCPRVANLPPSLHQNNSSEIESHTT